MATMEQPNLPKKERFADLVATTADHATPGWARNSQTNLAYGTGRLPQHAKQIGWQPLAGPGAATVKPALSNSMQSLRQRIVRGEA